MEKLRQAITTHKVLFASLVILCFGFGLLWSTIYFEWFAHHSITRELVREFAKLLVVSVAVALIWDLVGKRTFLKEIMGVVHLSENTQKAGVEEILFSFTLDARWADFFSGISEFDAFIAYGRTWRNTVRTHLVALAQNPLAKVQIILPDPANESVVGELARRFGLEPSKTKDLIEESVREYDEIFAHAACAYRRVLVSTAPVYSYYRFGTRILVAFYKNRTDRGEVPALLLGPGALSSFFRSDIDGMVG